MTRTAWHRPDSRVARLAGIAALLLAPAAAASDHADPINLDRLEGGITDLFVFPAKDGVRRVNRKAITVREANQLAVILCVRRSLTTPPPYPGLNEFDYAIFMDLHSPVRFDNELDRQRYGGIVTNPERIDPDFSIKIRLNDNTSIKELKVEAKEESGWKVRAWKKDGKWEGRKGRFEEPYSGVRDDPFIFPMFFGTNVIAMVLDVPLDWFPGMPQDFLIWATSSRHGVPIDHVGRSQRTQLPRFDLLNTLPPREHVAALKKKDGDPGLLDDLLRTRIRPVFNLRNYDYQPDVMVFTRRDGFPAEYPNGRQLEDDVAYKTCMEGDCQLYELSFNVKDPMKYQKTNGRPTENDKPFSDTFPYLAEPWPDKEEAPPPELTMTNRLRLAGLVALVAVVFLTPWVLYFRAVRRLRAGARQLAAAARHRGPADPQPPRPGS
jgi:hypothetical protein